MSPPSLHYSSCADAQSGHRLAYWQWGDPAAPHAVVCVHGLSRQARDFDVLAAALVARAPSGIRVICPDMPGRGDSDWLTDPMGYQVPRYAHDVKQLLASLHTAATISALDWVGTSMGGLIGLFIAGSAAGMTEKAGVVPIRRLVLNDVGPAIQWRAIQRIGQYLGKAGHFDTVEQAADAMLAVSSGFGPHTKEAWLALSRPMLRRVSNAPDSKWRLHYDPAIAVPFNQATEAGTADGETLLWQLYDHTTAQTLLLRGRDSDLLSPATAEAMTQRGPRARLVEFDQVGHAPTLVAADQVNCVCQFLLS